MDPKVIYVRTRKGDDEAHGKTSHIAGDVRRALLMVDGKSTFEEIKKRAAPSLRSSLEEMFEELEKGGYIQDKHLKNKPAPSAKAGTPPKMSMPSGLVVPKGQQQVSRSKDETGEDLDFLSGYSAAPPVSDAALAAAELAAAEAAAAAAREADAEKLKAEQEAAKIREETARRAKEEAEAARIKAEAEAKVQREMEAARIKAEDEARVQRELEAARIKAEQEVRLRLEAEAREREAARIKAEQEEAAMKRELEAARIKAEQEVRFRFEIAAKEREQAEAARIKAEEEARRQREFEELRIKAELEAKAKLEAEARAYARIKAEDEAVKSREAAELAASEASKPKDEDDIAQKMASELSKAFGGGGETKKNEPFAFGNFDVGGSKAADIPKQEAPAKGQGFAFGAFNVEAPKPVAEPQRKDSAKPGVPPEKSPKPGQPDNRSRSPDQPQGIGSSPQVSPSQEQIHRAAQARIAAEERAAKEAEAKREAEERAAKELQAKRLADEQSKLWAEAEQRALQEAKAKSERPVQSNEISVPEKKTAVPSAAPVPRRKSGSTGKLFGFVFKLAIFLVVLAIGALFVVPNFLPARDYMPKVEKMLSERLHQPVHIGHLGGRILPMPRLELGEIYLGDAKQFQAVQADLNFSLAGLFNDVKPISSVDFQGVKVRGIALPDVSAWLQQLAAGKDYPVAHMTITQGSLDAEAFELSSIEGDLNFDPSGKFIQMNLRANGGKYSIALSASQGSKYQVSFAAHGAELPLLPNWTFDDMNAKGELNDSGVVFSEYGAHILGGTLQGNASINWRSGWRADGTLNAKKITMRQLNHLLEGNVDGTGRFRMSSVNLAGLTDSVSADGDFQASDGMLGGMDIIETARTRSKEHLPGGRTPFDSITGSVSYSDNIYHFKQTKIATKVGNATASFDVAKQQVSGKMNVNWALQGGSGSVVLQIGGSTDSPTLHY